MTEDGGGPPKPARTIKVSTVVEIVVVLFIIVGALLIKNASDDPQNLADQTGRPVAVVDDNGNIQSVVAPGGNGATTPTTAAYPPNYKSVVAGLGESLFDCVGQGQMVTTPEAHSIISTTFKHAGTSQQVQPDFDLEYAQEGDVIDVTFMATINRTEQSKRTITVVYHTTRNANTNTHWFAQGCG